MNDQDLRILELQKQNISLQDKVTFMYIATSTASIGYISTQIKDLAFSSWNLLPFFSISLFGLSFIAGTKYLEHFLDIIKIDAITLRDKKDLQDKREETGIKMIQTFKEQKRCIFLGALTYITWLLLRMSER